MQLKNAFSLWVKVCKTKVRRQTVQYNSTAPATNPHQIRPQLATHKYIVGQKN